MKPIEQSTLSQPIYDSLKRMIIEKELKPGEKIIQEKIAAQMGVSRTPLAKALQMLEHELLVESIPRRGMFVRQTSLSEMIEVYYCRESIECMAVRLTTIRALKEDIIKLKKLFNPFVEQKGKINLDQYRKADEVFHNSIIELSQNEILGRMSKLNYIHSQVYSLGLLRTPEETLDDHIRILDAMIAGDSVKAETEMKRHMKLSREILEKYKQEEESKKES